MVRQYSSKSTIMTKERSKQLREKVTEKRESGNGYKKITISLDLPLKSIITKCCTARLSLPRAGGHHNPGKMKMGAGVWMH